MNELSHDPSPPPPTPASLHADEGSRLREVVQKANERIRKLTWPEIAVAALAGFAVGYLAASPRRHPTLREIADDSLRPWLSRNLHDAYGSVRASRPVASLSDQISKLRAS